MGGFKNELIESQVEVGDRIPAPIPASKQVGLSRRSMREHDKWLKRMLWQARWELSRMFLLGIVLGVTTMILIGLA